MPINYSEYPDNWKEISEFIRFKRANNKCETCGAVNHSYVNKKTRELCLPDEDDAIQIILTVAHIRHDKMDVRYNPDKYDPEDADNNLVAECQRCHLWRDRHLHASNRKYGKRKNQLNLGF